MGSNTPLDSGGGRTVFGFASRKRSKFMADGVSSANDDLQRSGPCPPGKDPLSSKPSLSYAATLRNQSSDDMFEDEIELSDEDCKVVEGKHGPGLQFSERAIAVLARPWRFAVVINLMGRPSLVNTYDFILRGLRRKWRLCGRWKLIDLLNDFFIVKFELEDDMQEALCGGPWVLAGQTLVVRRWSTTFNPVNDRVSSIAVWARVVGLPVMHFNEYSLSRIGNLLGEVVKIDPITKEHGRGRYAWICVEVDLSMPFKSDVLVNSMYYKVKYERFDMLCFSCGVFGHSKEKCPQNGVQNMDSHAYVDMSGPKSDLPDAVSDGQKLNKQDLPSADGEDGFGPWMLVNYRTKKKNVKSGVNSQEKVHGSRFSALQEDVQETSILDDVVPKSRPEPDAVVKKHVIIIAKQWTKAQYDALDEAILGPPEYLELSNEPPKASAGVKPTTSKISKPASDLRVPLNDLSNSSSSRGKGPVRGARKGAFGGVKSGDVGGKKSGPVPVRQPFGINQAPVVSNFPGYFGRMPPEELITKECVSTIDIHIEVGKECECSNVDGFMEFVPGGHAAPLEEMPVEI